MLAGSVVTLSKSGKPRPLLKKFTRYFEEVVFLAVKDGQRIVASAIGVRRMMTMSDFILRVG